MGSMEIVWPVYAKTGVWLGLRREKRYGSFSSGSAIAPRIVWSGGNVYAKAGVWLGLRREKRYRSFSPVTGVAMRPR